MQGWQIAKLCDFQIPRYMYGLSEWLMDGLFGLIVKKNNYEQAGPSIHSTELSNMYKIHHYALCFIGTNQSLPMYIVVLIAAVAVMQLMPLISHIRRRLAHQIGICENHRLIDRWICQSETQTVTALRVHLRVDGGAQVGECIAEVLCASADLKFLYFIVWERIVVYSDRLQSCKWTEWNLQSDIIAYHIMPLSIT